MKNNKWIAEQLDKTNLLLESTGNKLDAILLILRKINAKKVKEDKKNGIQ